MLSDFLLKEVGEYIKDKVKTAEVVFENEKPREVEILRKTLDGDLLKIFVNTTKGVGTIVDIRLLDKDKNILISKPRGRIKTIDHAIVSTFWIRIVEEEIDNPVNIFELKEGLNG